jgi:hypothetical protein
MLQDLDYRGLLQNPPSTSAINDTAQKIKTQPCLKKHRDRKAGLVLAFGGAVAPDNTVNADTGREIASRVNTFVLPRLGKQESFIFSNDTVYDAYHDLGNSYGNVAFTIYIFA